MSRRPDGYRGAAQAIRKAARDEAFGQSPPITLWRVKSLGPMTLESLQAANLTPISVADDDVEQIGPIDTYAAVGDRAYVHRTPTGDYVIAGLAGKDASGTSPAGSPAAPPAMAGAAPEVDAIEALQREVDELRRRVEDLEDWRRDTVERR